tara:strand:+ start:974 stop:1588 length:615 start_codon:yes stop_codon:yes gene_type:complete
MVWYFIYTILIFELFMVLVFFTDPNEKIDYNESLNINLGVGKWKSVNNQSTILGSENSLLVIGKSDLSQERKMTFQEVFNKARKLKLKIIGVDHGMFLINEIFGGEKYFNKVCTSNEIFIGLGTKLASIIGGSGNVKVSSSRLNNLKINSKADNLMISAMNHEKGFIEAIEVKGEEEILGILWPLFGENKLPKGFENIVKYIVD